MKGRPIFSSDDPIQDIFASSIPPQKQEIRNSIRHHRKTLSDTERDKRADSIASVFSSAILTDKNTYIDHTHNELHKLFTQDSSKKSEFHIASFMPMNTEPDILPLLRTIERKQTFNTTQRIYFWFPRIEESRQLSWGIAAPNRYHDPQNPYNFVQDFVKNSYFSLKEPSKQQSFFYDDLHAQGIDFDLLFVPALAVSNKGHRLGQGGGYYDTFLNSLQSTKSAIPPLISINYEEEILYAQDFPQENHDQRIDYTLTEKRLHHWADSSSTSEEAAVL